MPTKIPTAPTLDSVDALEPFPTEFARAEAALRSNCHQQAGIGLSGGGIRSATLSLGIFQALAKHKLLKHVGFLSTVSGGGYFGGFLGRLYQRFGDKRTETAADDREHNWFVRLKAFIPGLKQPDPDSSKQNVQGEDKGQKPSEPDPRPDVTQSVQGVLDNSDAEEVRFLRENGRYLAPAGSGDLALAAAVTVRNLVSIHVVIWVALLAIFLTLNLARFGIDLAVEWPTTAWITSVFPWNGDPFPLPLSGSWFWPSPWLAAVVPIFALAVVPLGWAYWLVPAPKSNASEKAWRWILPTGVLAAGSGMALMTTNSAQRVGVVAVVISAATVFIYWLSTTRRSPDTPNPRNSLSRALAGAIAVLVVIAALAVIDSFGQTLYWGYFDWEPLHEGLAGVGGMLIGIIAVFRKLAVAGKVPDSARVRLPVALLAGTAATLLLVLLLSVVSSLGHGFAWNWQDPTSLSPTTPTVQGIGVFALIAVGASLVMGRVWTFVNRSSMHPFYESRLRRAYLGASNEARHSDVCPSMSVTHPDDGIAFSEYHPERYGGPIHLINVTVNETVDGRSQIQQQDRKGTGLAVGSAGVSFGKRHHARSPVPAWATETKGTETATDRVSPFRVFPDNGLIHPEPFDLGEWIAISGAAFSPGAGYRTSLGLSIFATLFNVRLGYWWDSGVSPGSRHQTARKGQWHSWESRLGKLFPVQASFFAEMLGRFAGVGGRRWYLSDGGHYENMGGYELIRRGLPFIVICDNEEDPTYRFVGLANLIRKARIDFGAEITFLDTGKLDKVLGKGSPLRKYFGELDQLRRGMWSQEPVDDPLTSKRRVSVSVDTSRLSRAYAALAEIKYASGDPGLLLYIKPTLIGGEPADILEYHGRHPKFPQEPTADQFFDEEQWESYRALAQHIADALFKEVKHGWSPALSLKNPEAGMERFEYEQTQPDNAVPTR